MSNRLWPNQCSDIEELPSPRIFATHMPFQMLHEPLRYSPWKVVYVCRNVKDVLVSRWHFRNKLLHPVVTYDDVQRGLEPLLSLFFKKIGLAHRF
ncbi:hypothetical protein YC2023_006309 [Brassica napus]